MQQLEARSTVILAGGAEDEYTVGALYDYSLRGIAQDTSAGVPAVEPCRIGFFVNADAEALNRRLPEVEFDTSRAFGILIPAAVTADPPGPLRVTPSASDRLTAGVSTSMQSTVFEVLVSYALTT